MKVLKFGGSSLADFACLKQVAELAKGQLEDQMLLVLSAPGGMTDSLVELSELAAKGQDYSAAWQALVTRSEGLKAQVSEIAVVTNWPNFDELKQKLDGVALIGHCPAQVKAYVISFGERVSVSLMQALLNELSPVYLEATKCIASNNNYLDAEVDLTQSKQQFAKQLAAQPSKVYIMPGFTAASEQGELTTLGRNGSDYSAAIAAACVDAKICQIWTDVDGVYSADPRYIKSAMKIDSLSYKEAMELSYFGAKVLHPKTILPCAKYGVPCEIKNTHDPDVPGSLISAQSSSNGEPVKALSSLQDLAMITVSGPGMKGKVGMASRVFSALAQDEISIVLITQSSCEFSISFCVYQADLAKATNALEQAFALEGQAGLIEPFQIEQNLAIVTLVGDNMKAHKGLAAKFFASLAQAQVNIVAIAQDSTESAISAVIDGQSCNDAVKVCHENFFTHVPSIDVFLLGCGLVGKELVSQLQRQQEWLQKRNIKLNLYGVANSRQMLLDSDGVDFENWQMQLADSQQSFDLKAVEQFVKENHLINPVLVDCSSSQFLAEQYLDFINAGFHVVAANKKANTSSQAYYQSLVAATQKTGRKFLYETNVGAGLPVLDNLQLLFGAGDKLLSFNGILSGSLSYMFGVVEDGLSLSAATKQAKENGFTEPDPRDDLSGMDVARKLLIIARESGLQLELDDIDVEPVISPKFAEGASVDEFMARLPELDAEFTARVESAKADGKVLRYVGSIEDGKCKVGIQAVSKEDALNSVRDGENALAILSQYYQPKPFVIRGYGAGAEVTAAGVFADILKTLP
ncbi:Bifunctional aspartokinase/homoserine dehydrogenase 1 [Pseudoalteromonas sp. P1-9]|uniref:bifunctional aspartate kinase/homoserine dehydrogenase I n=1 Tax=Pseudoalteromonas sp. P1-9 TaxID=1710354 RepID=UPI0006D60DAD|nr:bifunctional aspartate kinase/homoserine dehydrogenase I [Pseudoalteromonas sp. P1-9]KPV97418.1 Bifunctional aspartokinase/homoserine dehydrogenase 1 [Pseudoalteromonas sp. P1-9]